VYAVTCESDLRDNNELTYLPYALNFGFQLVSLLVLSRKLVTFHFIVLVGLVMVADKSADGVSGRWCKWRDLLDKVVVIKFKPLIEP